MVIRIGIAALSSTREHVRDPWHSVGGLEFPGCKISGPLHGRLVGAHRRLSDDIRIARHASKSVRALT